MLSGILASGAEYAEFDIRKTADHVLVVYHDGQRRARRPALRQLGTRNSATGWATRCPGGRGDGSPRGRLIGHLDLKETGYEVNVVALASSILGPGNLSSPPWKMRRSPRSSGPSRRSGPHCRWDAASGSAAPPVGGRPAQRIVTRCRGSGPCGADWVAANYRIARLGVARGVPPQRHRRHGVDRRPGPPDRPVPPGPAHRRPHHQPSGPRGPAPGRAGAQRQPGCLRHPRLGCAARPGASRGPAGRG